MELTVILTKDQWEFVLEVLDLNQTNQIKAAALGLLKPQLDEQFNVVKEKG